MHSAIRVYSLLWHSSKCVQLNSLLFVFIGEPATAAPKIYVYQYFQLKMETRSPCSARSQENLFLFSFSLSCALARFTTESYARMFNCSLYFGGAFVVVGDVVVSIFHSKQHTPTKKKTSSFFPKLTQNQYSTVFFYGDFGVFAFHGI